MYFARYFWIAGVFSLALFSYTFIPTSSAFAKEVPIEEIELKKIMRSQWCTAGSRSVRFIGTRKKR